MVRPTLTSSLLVRKFTRVGTTKTLAQARNSSIVTTGSLERPQAPVWWEKSASKVSKSLTIATPNTSARHRFFFRMFLLLT